MINFALSITMLGAAFFVGSILNSMGIHPLLALVMGVFLGGYLIGFLGRLFPLLVVSLNTIIWVWGAWTVLDWMNAEPVNVFFGSLFGGMLGFLALYVPLAPLVNQSLGFWMGKFNNPSQASKDRKLEGSSPRQYFDSLDGTEKDLYAFKEVLSIGRISCEVANRVSQQLFDGRTLKPEAIGEVGVKDPSALTQDCIEHLYKRSAISESERDYLLFGTNWFAMTQEWSEELELKRKAAEPVRGRSSRRGRRRYG